MRPPLASPPLPLPGSLGERCRAKLWLLLLQRVVEAVNQRGMCAVELGRLADLPSDEIVSLQSRCGCPNCFQKRAN